MAVNIANTFYQRIVHVTLSTILKSWYQNMPQICRNKRFLMLVWIFIITNDDVNNENLDLRGPASSILTISTMDMVSQN